MKVLLGGLIAIVLGIGIWFYAHSHRTPATPVRDTAVEQELAQGKARQEIRAQVVAFGAVLQNVSLLAPTAASDIDREYTPYITRSLRSTWENNPSIALGRTTSSPWPDHIDVASIEPGVNNTYAVRALLVFMTSDEMQKGGDAGSSTMQFIVVNEDGVWKIDSVTVLRQNKPNAPRTTQDLPQLE